MNAASFEPPRGQKSLVRVRRFEFAPFAAARFTVRATVHRQFMLVDRI
jgi:hypothetical protein